MTDDAHTEGQKKLIRERLEKLGAKDTPSEDRVELHEEALKAGAGVDKPCDCAEERFKEMTDALRGDDFSLPLVRSMVQRLIMRLHRVAEEITEIELVTHELAEKVKQG